MWKVDIPYTRFIGGDIPYTRFVGGNIPYTRTIGGDIPYTKGAGRAPLLSYNSYVMSDMPLISNVVGESTLGLVSYIPV